MSEDDRIVDLNTLIDSVFSEASADAKSFVKEFGEQIDPAATDWDAAAFEDWARRHRDDLEDDDVKEVMSLVYRNALVVQTGWLVAGLPDFKPLSAGFHDDDVVVYHRSRAGQIGPHSDPGGDWYFQPTDVDDGDVFSAGYPTPIAAYRGAVDWATGKDLEGQLAEEDD